MASRQKNKGSRDPLVYFSAPFSQNQDLCLSSKQRKRTALGSGLHAKSFMAPGLQR